MATAPRPGASKRLELDLEQSKMLDSGFRITCGAENRTVEILFGDLSAEDDIACANEIGFTPAELLPRATDYTVVLVFYWLGLRATGDRRKFANVLDKFGTPRKFIAGDFEAFGLGLLAEDDDGAPEEDESADPTQPAEQ